MTPTLIFERAVHRDPDDGSLKSYWEEMWSLQALALESINVGSPVFSASYLNDPSALEGNKLQVAWLKPYTEAELEAARAVHGVKRGMIYAGVDPTAGGGGSNPDWTAIFITEVIDNLGFAREYIASHQSVDTQPKFIESVLDLWRPDVVTLEETSDQGFVGTAMKSQINDGKGSKWPISVEKPQGARTIGGKERRLMAVAARWESGQIKLPGIVNANGAMVVHPHWDLFVAQWRSFPVGHDDILDAAYWSVYPAFSDVVAGGVARGPEGKTAAEARELAANRTPVAPATDSHGRILRPIGARRPRQSVRFNDRRGGGSNPYARE